MSRERRSPVIKASQNCNRAVATPALGSGRAASRLGGFMKAVRLTLAVLGAATILHAAQAADTITGAGSTLAQPVYEKWADAYASQGGAKLNYQGVGSGAGQKLIFQRTIDFGASDAPVPAAKLSENKLLQFPTVIGAVDLAVNIPGIQPNQLALNGKLLAAIYLGKITNWNDPQLAAMNPGVKLPDLAVAPIYRADGSGTTYVFTSYLSKISPDFKGQVGADKAVSWPAGTGAKGTAGVAGAVRNTSGAIGYVESAYATLNHLTTVKLQTHDGAFIAPSLDNFAAAAARSNWTGAANFAVDMNDQPGSNSWPIVSTTFVLLPTNPANVHTGGEVVKFFSWALDNGDPAARELQYVPLPAKVKDQVRIAWKALSFLK